MHRASPQEDDSGQDVYYASLRHFSQRMRKDWAGIMSKGRNETGFLVKTFTYVPKKQTGCISTQFGLQLKAALVACFLCGGCRCCWVY